MNDKTIHPDSRSERVWEENADWIRWVGLARYWNDLEISGAIASPDVSVFYAGLLRSGLTHRGIKRLLLRLCPALRGTDAGKIYQAYPGREMPGG